MAGLFIWSQTNRKPDYQTALIGSVSWWQDEIFVTASTGRRRMTDERWVAGTACGTVQKQPSGDSRVRCQRAALCRRKWRHRAPVVAAAGDVDRRWRCAAVGSAGGFQRAALPCDDLAVLRLRWICSDASLPRSSPLKPHHVRFTNSSH